MLHERITHFFEMGTYRMYTIATLCIGVILLAGWYAVGDVRADAQYASAVRDVESITEQTLQVYQEHFSTLAEEDGGVFAFEVLKRVELPANIDMHLLGHFIGDELYAQQGINGMRHCSHDFRNACSHSVVIGALLQDGVGILKDGSIHEACQNAPGGRGAYTMCFHGFGHGALAFANYDVAEAVDLCRMVGTEAYGNREFQECIGGMTMEMASGVHDPNTWREQKKKYITEGDPLSFCKHDAIPDDAKQMCITYITPELFSAAGDLGNPSPETFERAFEYCEGLPQEQYITCAGSFGKEFVVLAQDRDIRNIGAMSRERVARVYEWCTLAPDAQGKEACWRIALNSLFWGGENIPDASARLCAIIEERSGTDACYGWMYENAQFYSQNDAAKQAICDVVSENHRNSCKVRLGLQ